MSGIFNLFKKPKQVFSFTLTIHQLIINFSKPVRVSLIFHHRDFNSGKKKVESSRFPYSPSIGTVDLNETLTLQHTIFKEKSGIFKPKVINLIVQAHLDNNTSKKIAGLDLDLAEFCTLPIKHQTFSLKDAPDKQAKLSLSISAVPCNDPCDSVTGDSGTEGDYSNDSKSKKPPVFPGKLEENLKISQLENLLNEIQRERDELRVKMKVKTELFENEKQQLFDRLAELDQINSDLQGQGVKSKKRKIEYKRQWKSLKNSNENLKIRINELEEELGTLECQLEKHRIRKRGLKEQMKEILINEQKLSQELIMAQTTNSELNKKIKEKNQLVDIENVETRSRRNTDVICKIYSAQLKNQVQILEDQKQAALTTQTELAFTVQKMKTQYLEQEQRHKFEIMKLESEISSLRSPQVSEVMFFPHFDLKKPLGNCKNPRKNKIFELVKNVRELKTRKEEVEAALKSLEGVKPVILEENQENLKNSNFKQITEELENTRRLLRLSQKESQTLANKLKLISEEDTEGTVNLLQDQLVACEKELEKVSEELSLQKSKHFAEISLLLEKNSEIQEKMKEEQKKFQLKLKEIADERDFILKTSRISE
jgi:hypothetical protein